MVKRGGKEIVTVEIYKQVYDTLKERANLENSSVKDFINQILQNEVKRAKVLIRYFPHLSKVGMVGDILVVRDKKIKDDVDIFESNGKLFCEHCESNDCVHIQYVMMLPDGLKLLKGKLYENDTNSYKGFDK
jgi:predicted CopG family antitoxin